MCLLLRIDLSMDHRSGTMWRDLMEWNRPRSSKKVYQKAYSDSTGGLVSPAGLHTVFSITQFTLPKGSGLGG